MSRKRARRGWDMTLGKITKFVQMNIIYFMVMNFHLERVQTEIGFFD